MVLSRRAKWALAIAGVISVLLILNVSFGVSWAGYVFLLLLILLAFGDWIWGIVFFGRNSRFERKLQAERDEFNKRLPPQD